MATQHPDNASAPYWETGNGSSKVTLVKKDGFVSAQEELTECVSAFEKLGVGEFMWDWEGKHVDEAVIDKLYTVYHHFCQKNRIGRDVFLTFRIPNIWHEKGYSLLRAFMVILTSEDFAKDLGFKDRPLFEVILPMTEKAEELMYIQTSFHKLARFKYKTFIHTKPNTDCIEVIPLVESVEGQMEIRKLLSRYVDLYKKEFRVKPIYIRPFLARSDPALISGLLATVLANKIALSEIATFSRIYKIPTYPIIGAGSLPFRGGLNPEGIKTFLQQYGGVRTATIQSGFRYDYPLPQVKRAINQLNKNIAKTKAIIIPEQELAVLRSIVKKSAQVYQDTLQKITKDMAPLFAAVPRRRERRLHVGLLSYNRQVGKSKLPRAINFTAAFYTLGIPPEFIGLGRVLNGLTKEELQLVKKYYPTMGINLKQAGAYLNRKNLEQLSQEKRGWKLIKQDVELTEKLLGISLQPRGVEAQEHVRLSSQTVRLFANRKKLEKLIIKTGKLRKSLG